MLFFSFRIDGSRSPVSLPDKSDRVLIDRDVIRVSVGIGL